MNIVFNGQEKEKLKQAILSLFDLFSFRQFLSGRLDKDFFNIVSLAAAYDYQVFEVITRANQEGWAEQLLSALLQERPGNEVLAKIALIKGRLTEAYQSDIENVLLTDKLEKLVNSDPLLNPAVFTEGLVRTKRCVCRIAISNPEKTEYGTGFLVAEDLILSNYHVFKSVIDKPELGANVICKFDYELSESGTLINGGLDVGLSAVNPIVAYSPYCEYDLTGTANVEVKWPDGQFDYALVRLEQRIGEEPFGINLATAGPQAAKRGWISLPEPTVPIREGGHVLILQHPEKRLLQLGIGFSKIIGTDKEEKRVRYAVNTMAGSSGAPCFDENFNWIAVHNMGDPNWNAAYNQGIPAPRIVSDLETKNIKLP